jgi:hypothetical protein
MARKLQLNRNLERLGEIPAALVPGTERLVEGIFKFADGFTHLNSGKKLPTINAGALESLKSKTDCR